jgi:DNA-binding XRE family transcriptional regulator
MRGARSLGEKGAITPAALEANHSPRSGDLGHPPYRAPGRIVVLDNAANIHKVCVHVKGVTLAGVRKSRFTPHYARLLERLRALRAERGVLQIELARKLGVPQQYVSRYESGETRMDVVQLWRYCRALGVSFTICCKSLDRDFSLLGEFQTKPRP